MSKKLVLLFPVLILSSLATPIATVTRVEHSISGIELKYRTSPPMQQGWVYVLVETSVFGKIETSLDRYARDLESIEGFSVGIYTVSTSNTTSVKFLLQQASPEGLVGCLLVGDIPEARFQYGPPEYWNETDFSTDFFYMDLDGVWNDTNNDGVYDKLGGEAGAEIWVGRLQPSLVSGDPIQLLNNYFEKNHLYRTGNLTLPKRALVYADPLLIDEEAWATNIRIAYEDTLLVGDTKTTDTSDYRRRLEEGYEWISLESHGGPGSHTFLDVSGGWDGKLTGLDYREIDPRTSFYVFCVCHAALGYNNLASSVVFTDTYGLLAIGPTKMTAGWGPNATFYEALCNGKNIGNAYLEDVKLYESRERVYPETGTKISVEEYSWIMVGDPSLRIKGYSQQTEPLQPWIVALIVMIIGIGAVLLVYFVRVKRKAEKAGVPSEKN